ncbi:MAG: Eco29kI family restriction endonuclease [Candidatus Brocadiia bacterium]
MREDELGSFDPLDYRNIAKTVVRELLAGELVPLGTLEPFDGAGIYALYYTGPFEAYAPISAPEPSVPIYVGKAIPPGSRTGSDEFDPEVGRALYSRLGEHRRTIEVAENLELSDFMCRFLTVKHLWVPLSERILIQTIRPVWNVVVDGFGDHDPGSGRRNMRRPKWDVVHPGRHWAHKLEPEHEPDDVLREVAQHFARLRETGISPFSR